MARQLDYPYLKTMTKRAFVIEWQIITKKQQSATSTEQSHTFRLLISPQKGFDNEWVLVTFFYTTQMLLETNSWPNFFFEVLIPQLEGQNLVVFYDRSVKFFESIYDFCPLLALALHQ